MKLNERAVLTALHVRAWTGNAIDQEVTEEVSESHKSDPKDSGRYTKQLISKKALREVSQRVGLIRRTHKLLTLPWDDNKRILSTAGYVGYTEQMRMNRLNVEAAVTNFVESYPYHVQEAKTRLGTMFQEGDYPAPEAVRGRFAVDVEILPVPDSTDFRAELGEASVKAIVSDIEARTEARLQAAVNDVFLRVVAVTEHMVERLRAYKPANGGRPENTFKDSLVYNVQELADLLPSLNITNDPRLDALQQRLVDDLAEHSPDILRDNDRIRAKTADKAEQILKKARSFLV